MSKKFLILTASFWSWHNSAARAICNQITKEKHSYEIYDIVDFFWWENGKKIQDLQVFMAEKIPFSRASIFFLSDQEKLIELLQKINPLQNHKKFEEIIKKYGPEKIIIVHPFRLTLLEKYTEKNKKTFTIWTIITDCQNIHSSRHIHHEIVDFYFFIDQKTQQIFHKKFNHLEKNTICSFFPLEKDFFHNKSNKKIQKIGLLLTALPINFTEKLLTTFIWKKQKILIIKGRNQRDFLKLKAQFQQNNNFHFEEFIPIAKELKNIDCMIAKAWWALMSECIANDVPMIVPQFIPGQEKWNVDNIIENKIGIYEKNPKKILEYIEKCDLSKIQKNCQKMKKKNSCEIIIRTMMWKN